MPTILGANSVRETGYNVANSCRFESGHSDNLSRTNVSSVTNQFKWTFSFWVKLSDLFASRDGNPFLFSDFTDSNNRGGIFFESDNTLRINDRVGGSTVLERRTNRKFRDTSAWYHIVVNHDRTVSSPTTEVYVNGVEETSFSATTNPSQNGTSAFNKASESSLIGKFGGGNEFFNGYIAEAVWIDGQALDSTSFGEFNDDSSSIWQPKDVSSLTFGNNGFYLDFEDSSNLGNDISGNSNDFTVNNLTAVDQSTDTCTNNFCTWSRLTPRHSAITLSRGALDITMGSFSRGIFATIGVSSGKWYYESKWVSGSFFQTGIVATSNMNDNDDVYGGKTGAFMYKQNGDIRSGGSTLASVSSLSTGDIVGVAIDMDNGFVYFSKNGTFQNSGNPASGSSGTGGFDISANSEYVPAASPTSAVLSGNFGSPSFSISSGNSDSEGFGNFEFSVPSGYFAICTKNLAEYGG
jgi:hypothetical protein